MLMVRRVDSQYVAIFYNSFYYDYKPLLNKMFTKRFRHNQIIKWMKFNLYGPVLLPLKPMAKFYTDFYGNKLQGLWLYIFGGHLLLVAPLEYANLF